MHHSLNQWDSPHLSLTRKVSPPAMARREVIIQPAICLHVPVGISRRMMGFGVLQQKKEKEAEASCTWPIIEACEMPVSSWSSLAAASAGDSP